VARYLLAATPIPGHANPVITVAGGLSARGHEVVVHTGSVFAPAVARSGARFVPLAPEIDIDYRTIDARFPERAALPPGAAQVLWGVRHLFADAIAAQYRGLCAILRDFPADAVLADVMFMGTLPLLLRPRVTRQVVAHLGISSLALSGPEVAFFGAGLPPARTAQQRARNQAALRFMERQVFSVVQNYINDVLKDCGAPRLPCFATDAVITLPDVYFQLGVPALEYDRALPSAIRFVGALPAPAPDRPLPHWWDDLEAARAAGRKIVMVTQGTIANADLGQLVLPSLAALARHDDVLLLATTSGADAARLEVPENARVADFIPYAAAFPYLDLLITNGGFGGVLLALRHGVPLLVAGDTEEKPEIAARVAYTGAGINLATGHPEVGLIEAAAREILADPGYRAAAARLAAQLEAMDALATIEAVLAEERTKPSVAA